MLGGPNDKVRSLTVVLAISLLDRGITPVTADGNPDPLPHPQILIRNPGDPGSKPFPEFIPHRDSAGEQSVSKPVRQKSVQLDNRLSLSKEFKPTKITPVKRTRFRSKDKKKIVLKRRKVKRLRAKSKNVSSSEESKNNIILGLAPEAHRGGSLAELALATLSEEEISREKLGSFPRNRDLQIMKGPEAPKSKKNRSGQKFLTFPTNRLKLALLRDNAAKERGNKSIKSNANSIKIRNRIKEINKPALRERLRNPDSAELSPISSIEDNPVSPFPNFPSIPNDNEVSNDEDEDVRAGRVIGNDIPNIGFEEFKLTPKKTLEELNLDTDSFLPILKTETKSSQQQFPIVSAVPGSKTVSDATTQHFPKPQPTTESIPARPQPSHTPVRGEPLPVSTFFDYGDNEDPRVPHDSVPPPLPVESFPNFPVPSSSANPPQSAPDSPPFPNIFNSPRPTHPDFPPLPSVTTPFSSDPLPQTTPQPIFQNQPEEPKSSPPFTFFQPIESNPVSENIIPNTPGPVSPGPTQVPFPRKLSPDAGKMKSHAETVVGSSVLGEIAYVDVDGQEKLLSYKRPSPVPAQEPLPPLLPAFLTQEPDLPLAAPFPSVPHPEEPPLFIRHHGSTLVPRLLPTPAPVPVQPSSVKPQSVPGPAAHPAPPPGPLFASRPLVGHQPPPGPSSRPTVLPTFTPGPATSFVHPGHSHQPSKRPRFEPHPRLLAPVPPPPYQTSFRRPGVPPPVLAARPRVPALTFLPPRPQAQLVTTIRPALVTTTSARLIQPQSHHRLPQLPVHSPFPHHTTPSPQHHSSTLPPPQPASPSPRTPFVVTQRFPSPSPIPLIWKPSGAVFTPKPFVHIHTTIQPIVIKSTRSSIHPSSSPSPFQPAYASPRPTASPAPFLRNVKPPQFTTPHPHFFTTPYPQTPYPPLRYFPSPLPTVHLPPSNYPYNGHALPAHVNFGKRSFSVRPASDLQTRASGSNIIDVVKPPDLESEVIKMGSKIA